MASRSSSPTSENSFLPPSQTAVLDPRPKQVVDPCGRHGAQGVLDGASKATLENEFGTHNEDECMTKILEMGMIQETEVRKCSPTKVRASRGSICLVNVVVQNSERHGTRNETMGPRQAH